MDISENTERLKVMADLCDIILDAKELDLVDKQEAGSHLDMYLSEIGSLIKKGADSTELPF